MLEQELIVDFIEQQITSYKREAPGIEVCYNKSEHRSVGYPFDKLRVC